MTDQMTDDEPTTEEEHPKGSREGLLLPIAIPVAVLALILLILFGFSRILLSLSHDAATVVALIVAVSIITIATLIASRDRLTNGALFSMVGAVAGVAMLAGGVAILAIGKGGGEGAGKPTQKPQAITLVAPKGAATAGFAQTSLTAQAGLPIELRFDNQDPGVQHNVVIFPEDPTKNPQATALFTGDLVSGPATQTYDVPALKSGTYYFHCAVHPTTMTGTITVGASTGGITLVAQGIQFDTKTLDLPPNQPVTITFDNRDAGTPHNFSIYSDPQKSKTLFQGDQVVGPTTTEYHVPALQPGTYYFQCDVHPTMNGSVVVGGSAGGSASPPPTASPS